MERESKPLVSIVILNYRRRTDLIRTLQCVESQSYQPREVIVVDNNSGDDTPAFLAQFFPAVRVLPLTENLGCGGRNRGVEAASGEIVVTLDNDVCLDSADELTKVVATFQERPDATALVFKVLDQRGKLLLRDWCHPRNAKESSDTEFETSFIAEGACAFRRDNFLRLGGYYEPLYIGCEGWDLALRMLNAGMRIVYCPRIRIRHWMSKATRSGRRPYYFYIRNNVWIAFKDYAGWRRWRFIAYSMAMMAFYCLRRPGETLNVWRGLCEGFRGSSRPVNTSISEQAWLRLKEIRAHRPTLWTRVWTHLWDSEM